MNDQNADLENTSSEVSQTLTLSPLHSALLKSLKDDESARALIALVIDYIMHLPIGRYIDLELLLETSREAYRPEALTSVLLRVLPEGLKRLQEAEMSTPSALGEWLTPELDAELRAFVMRAQLLRADRVQKWAHHPVTRHITRAFVEETLDRFVDRVKSSGGGGGLLGAAGRGAFGIAQRASRGVLGNITDQLQGQLKGLTSEFISASMGTLLDQLAKIVNTPEVAALLSEAQLKGYIDLTSQSVSALVASVRAEVPEWSEEDINEWSELIADWTGHLLARPEVEVWVIEIQKQIVRDLGDKSIAELIGGDEPVQTLKRALVDTLAPHLNDFVETPEFSAWCQRALISES